MNRREQSSGKSANISLKHIIIRSLESAFSQLPHCLPLFWVYYCVHHLLCYVFEFFGTSVTLPGDRGDDVKFLLRALGSSPSLRFLWESGQNKSIQYVCGILICFIEIKTGILSHLVFPFLYYSVSKTVFS